MSRYAVDATARAAVRALGWEESANEPVVWTAAGLAWGMVEGYTRGRGVPVDLMPTTFPPSEQEAIALHRAATPPADLAAVALAATLRLAPNPAQRVSESKATDSGGSHRVEGSFQGFTLAEQMVLNRYRRRVQ